MTIFVAGATGATGRLLVQQLLARGETVRSVVRSADRVPEEIRQHPGLTLSPANLLDLSDAELLAQVSDCSGVASCLGHNLSFRGIYGPPHRLVTDATRRLCAAIRESRPACPVRFVLMNTTANRNRDLEEPVSFGQKVVVGMLRGLLPPHADNEQAADFLRAGVGQRDGSIEWVAVRPDTLVDAEAPGEYELHASPTRDAIFNAGKTSRINVAHFMATLLTEESAWQKWRGQMPVIYNREEAPAGGNG